MSFSSFLVSLLSVLSMSVEASNSLMSDEGSVESLSLSEQPVTGSRIRSVIIMYGLNLLMGQAFYSTSGMIRDRVSLHMKAWLN